MAVHVGDRVAVDGIVSRHDDHLFVVCDDAGALLELAHPVGHRAGVGVPVAAAGVVQPGDVDGRLLRRVLGGVGERRGQRQGSEGQGCGEGAAQTLRGADRQQGRSAAEFPT